MELMRTCEKARRAACEQCIVLLPAGKLLVAIGELRDK